LALRLAIIADDLTGAHEAASHFALRGLQTRVIPRWETGEVNGEVIALSTRARSAARDAAVLTARAVSRFAPSSVDRLYLKVDSTMRGPVAAFVQGALEAWSARHRGAIAIVCPSHPLLGRTVRDGTVRLDNRPIDQGAPGDDLLNPVRTSRLGELLPGSVHVVPHDRRDPEAVATALEAVSVASSILTVDAECVEELTALAIAIDRLGPRAIAVGSGGLASTVAASLPSGGPGYAGRRTQARGSSGPVIVLVSSRHPLAREQSLRFISLRSPGLARLAPSLSDLSSDDTGLGPLYSLAEPQFVIVTPPRALPNHVADAAESVAAGMARVVAGVEEAYSARAAIVVGGDGAQALLERWNCESIDVYGSVMEGVPYGVVQGGTVEGLPIATKAGGFGDYDTIVQTADYFSRRGDE